MEAVMLDSLVLMMKRELADRNLACQCRDRLEGVLEELAGRHRVRRASEALERARILRDNIRRLLALLGEIDDYGPQEPDLSAFREAADLFGDIAHTASAAAAAMREAAANLAPESGREIQS
jgi:hypothetical protein